MMCVFFRNMMDVYAEGRLAEPGARRLERHASSCPACTAELAAWRRMFTELRSIPAAPPPKELADKIQTAAVAAKLKDGGYENYPERCRLLLCESAAAVFCAIMILVLSLSISFSGPGDSKTGGANYPIQ